MKKMIATVPEIMFEKYKPAITIATSILITLSAVPILFFIVLLFSEGIFTLQKSTNESSCTATNVTQGKIFSGEGEKPTCVFPICLVIFKRFREHIFFVDGFEEK
jgi:hypothetical protein